MANEKRLIDANALLEKFQFRLPINDHISEAIAECAKMAVRIIKDAPTVDAVEVVHAHWEDGCAIHNGKEVYKSIDRSHCEEVFKIESHDREYWKNRFKVCPFCGAKMDGDGNG